MNTGPSSHQTFLPPFYELFSTFSLARFSASSFPRQHPTGRFSAISFPRQDPSSHRTFLPPFYELFSTFSLARSSASPFPRQHPTGRFSAISFPRQDPSSHRTFLPPFYATTRPNDPTQQTDPLPLPFHGKPMATDPTIPISTSLSFHSSLAHGPTTMSVGNATDPARRDRPKGIIL